MNQLLFGPIKKEQTHIDVDRFDGIDMDIGGGGRTVPLAKLVAVVLLVWTETGWDRYGFRRGHGGVAYGPLKMKFVKLVKTHFLGLARDISAIFIHIYCLCLTNRVKKQNNTSY